jgi:protein gp37
LLGVSVEDQTRADQRRPAMHGLADLGWHTWVSYEPALGPVDWTGWQFTGWIVSGGESGEGSRPSDADWHRGARDFCAANDIPYFFKQWGQCLPAGQMQADGRIWQPLCGSTLRATKAFTGRFLDGIEHNDIEGPF